MTEQKQAREVAEVRYGEGNFDEKKVLVLEQKIQAQKKFGIQHLQLSEQEAEERAIEALKVDIASKKGGTRKKNKETVKKACRHFWNLGKKWISAFEVTEWAVEEESYHTSSPKGIGDTMGRGKNALFMEEGDAKVDGKKVLKIPNPDEFADWYESDVPLPREYYSEPYYDRLLIEEGASDHSTFFEDRI